MSDRIPLDHLTSDQYDDLCGELERLRADARQCAAQQWPQRLARAEAATDGELRRQLADAIRALGRSETELAGVRALHERWIKAGPPPLGQSISRWWDRRLAELGAALRSEEQPGPAAAQATEPGGWLHAGTRDLAIPDPEPSDPTECSGEEGFCPEHGFHRHSLKQPGPG